MIVVKGDGTIGKEKADLSLVDRRKLLDQDVYGTKK